MNKETKSKFYIFYIFVNGANDAGIKSILADYRNRYPNYDNRISDIKELMNIL